MQLKLSTRQRYAGLLRMQILPVWERVALSGVTHADVGEWACRMSDAGLAPPTVRQAHRAFSLLLALAVRDGRLPRNAPAADFRVLASLAAPTSVTLGSAPLQGDNARQWAQRSEE